MATLTIADLDNGKRDLQTVDEVANSRAATATTRFGQQTTTLYESIRRINASGDSQLSAIMARINAEGDAQLQAQNDAATAIIDDLQTNSDAQLAAQSAAANEVIRNLGFMVPVLYAPGLPVDSANFTVTYNDVIYAAQAGQVPFVSGAWDSTQWYPLQNLFADNDLKVFPDFVSASAAAASLPDGQPVVAPDSNGQRVSFNVSGGVLVPSGGVHNFRRSAVGAAVLEYQDRIAATPINLVDFEGAQDDKNFDSTGAFLKAAAAAQVWAALGKKAFIEVPPGDWKVAAKITLPFGTGVLGGGTIHAHTTQLFEWAGGVKDVCTSLKNIDVVAYVAPPNDGSGFALKFNAVRADRCVVDVNNFNVRSSDGITRSYGFDDYIKVHDLLKVTLSGLWFDCCFKANAGNVLAGQYLQNAVRVTGITTQLMVSDFLFASVYRGVYGTGSTTEGVRIVRGDMVAVYYGIDFPEYSKPGLWLDSLHINAVRQTIRIAGANTVDISISNVWLYRSNVFFSDTDWTAVSIEGATARTNLSNVNTSVSITTDTIYGIKLKDCSGVNAVGLGLSQTNRAIYHEGTNDRINYDAVVFNGLGATGVGLTTTATDNNITLGLHKFLGSVGTKYSLGSSNPTVIIDTGRMKYRALSSSPSIAAAATVTFTVEESQQLRILNFGAGTGAFNYDVQLDKANARQGDFVDIRLTFVASTNPTCRILNGVAGPVLGSIQGSAGSTTRYFTRIVYDGGNWIFADCHQSMF